MTSSLSAVHESVPMKLTRRQRIVAALGATLPVAAWCAGGSVFPACGGSQRAAAPLAEAAAPVADPGSGPVDCSVASPYEMLMDGTHSENFEFGAATGWYTNNEVCYPWTQAISECAEAGIVCYPGSQATPECIDAGSKLPGIWSSCFGTGVLNCADAGAALASCGSECLSIQPSPSFNADQLPAELIPNGGRCGSLYALHVKAGPFFNWGGNLGTRFPLSFDATGYDGIAVWMRTAPGFTNVPRITVSDQFTDSQYNQDLPVKNCDPNPNCQVQSSQGNANCYNVGCDTFGMYAPLTENWRLFILPFEEMRQGGWGKQRPKLDLSNLLSIQISFPVGTWDFWIDDIAFYRLKP
jgi:hypothetical protein